MSEDKRLERIENKIDDVNHRLGSIDTTLVAQHASIAEHIKRTRILESEFKPMRRKIHMAEGALAFISVIAVIATLVQLFR